MNSKVYKWCAVPQCKNTSIKAPNKVFVHVPHKKIIRDKWLKLARRNPNEVVTNSALYFCEDHFDLPNDMANYMEYHVMGSVSQVRMKPGCMPHKFICQPDTKKRTADGTERPYLAKRRKIILKESIKDFERKFTVAEQSSFEGIASGSLEVPECPDDAALNSQDDDGEEVERSLYQPPVSVASKKKTKKAAPEDPSTDNTPEIKKCDDEPVQVVPAQEHIIIAIQVPMKHYKSRTVQASIKKEDTMTSPFKTTVCTATSPFKVPAGRTGKLCVSTLSATKRKLNFFEDKYESDDESYTPSLADASGKEHAATAGASRLHAGYRCDQCRGDIIGPRYCCVECPNYDLCGTCEAAGRHAAHYVLRAPSDKPHVEVIAVLENIRNALLQREDAENMCNQELHFQVQVKVEVPDPDTSEQEEETFTIVEPPSEPSSDILGDVVVKLQLEEGQLVMESCRAVAEPAVCSHSGPAAPGATCNVEAYGGDGSGSGGGSETGSGCVVCRVHSWRRAAGAASVLQGSNVTQEKANGTSSAKRKSNSPPQHAKVKKK